MHECISISPTTFARSQGKFFESARLTEGKDRRMAEDSRDASYTLTIICARMWELFESVIRHDPSRLRGMKELSLVTEQTLNEINETFS